MAMTSATRSRVSENFWSSCTTRLSMWPRPRTNTHFSPDCRTIQSQVPLALTVGAVYDRPFFLDSTKYGRSETAPTGDSLRKAPRRRGPLPWQWVLSLGESLDVLEYAAVDVVKDLIRP